MAKRVHRGRVLIVEDDENLLKGIGDYLDKIGFHSICFSDSRKAAKALESLEVDAAVLDLRMPGLSGLELLPMVSEKLDVPTIMLTAYSDLHKAVEAMRLGAFDFKAKPLPPDALAELLDRALEHRSLKKENQLLKEESKGQAPSLPIVGKSPPLREVIRQIRLVAPSDCSVLIRGETGVGKELLARAIHSLSPQREGPFVSVNCAALNPSLVESTLFGHEDGAFTGAKKRHLGLFGQAQGGSLFLDEVGSMPSEIQGKLLRVLEDKSYQPLASTERKKARVRVLSATNAALEEDIKDGSFREDLFFRLNPVSIILPPLRERREDLIPLAEPFLFQFATELNRPITGMSSRARSQLLDYDWPGNVRQVRNVMHRAVLFAEKEQVIEDLANFLEDMDLGSCTGSRPGSKPDSRTDSMPDSGRMKGYLPTGIPNPLELEFAKARDEVLCQFERCYLTRLLQECRGNVSMASRRANINYKTLHRKLKQHGIERSDFFL